MNRAGLVADRILGSRLVTAISRQMTRQHLRILAYHGVSNVGSFRRQMMILTHYYEPVSVDQVTSALRGQAPLPAFAVWVTFDDGDVSVVENALPILDQLGIHATIFVCPGLLDTMTPFWWDVVDSALKLGETWTLDNQRFDNGDALIRRLKTLDDDHRRGIVATLSDSIVERTGRPLQRRQLTTAQLEQFLAAGGSIGNHTWDHPCLDRVDPRTQEVQIVRAHEWLTKVVGEPAHVFAYPNGNYTPITERVLHDLNYDVGALFDHRLAAVGGNPLGISRLRVNDYTSPSRFNTILSGIHPALHAMRNLRSP